MAVGHQDAPVGEEKIEFPLAGDGIGEAIQRIEPGLMIVGGVGSGDPANIWQKACSESVSPTGW